jgi:hypothetical protein
MQLNLARSEIQKLSATVENDVAERLRIIAAVDEQQQNELTALKAELEHLRLRTDPDVLLVAELRRLFPALASIEWKSVKDENGNEVRVIAGSAQPEASDAGIAQIRSEIEKYLKERRPKETPVLELSRPTSNESAETK